MRRREISPEFWTDERVVELSDGAKLLFIGLWNLADREGRLEDKPLSIGFKVRPWAPREVPAFLGELASGGLIIRYSVDGTNCIEVPGFVEHQRPHPKEQASKLPARPEISRQAVESNDTPRNSDTCRAGSSFPSGSSGPSGPAEVASAERSAREETGPRVVYDGEGLLTPTDPPSQVPPRKPQKRRDPTEADPRHQPLVEALTMAFMKVRKAKYPFTPRDALAVKALLTSGISPPEVTEAWVRALQHVGYPSVSTLSEFHDRLAHFVAQRPNAKAQADPAAGWSGTGALTVTRMEPPP